MKIICTSEEKARIVCTLVRSSDCPFDPTITVTCDNTITCKECINSRIEWEIKDGEQK